MSMKNVSFLLIIYLLILVLDSCDSPNEPDDNTAPTVKIISPQNNSTVSGIITVICVATDNKGVAKLELWINGNNTGIIDNSEPFELDWNTKNYGNGSYIITVRCYDINNNQVDSEPITLNIKNPPPMSMVLITGGTFVLGDTWGEGESDEVPTHIVKLDSFFMGAYEVTQKQYETLMGFNPSKVIGDSLPVETLSWYEAIDFCNALSSQEGLASCYTINGANVVCDFSANGYRLPTEAEWEFAARGGNLSQNFKYSGSNNIDEVAWYSSNSNGITHVVGSNISNELGIYDLSGNVWEWCWDWYGKYSSSSQINPTGPSSGSYKVIRGGSCKYPANRQRISERAKTNLTQIIMNLSDLGWRGLFK